MCGHHKYHRRSSTTSFAWSKDVSNNPNHFDYLHFDADSVKFEVDGEQFWKYAVYLEKKEFVFSSRSGKLKANFILHPM